MATIYFGGDDGNIYAVDAANGRQLWKHATGGPVPSTPAVAMERFTPLATTENSTRSMRGPAGCAGNSRPAANAASKRKGLHGLQPKNQTIADPFDVFLSSPVVARGAVYFGSGDGNLYAVDAATGELRWKFQTGDVVHASPAYADGVLYFGSWDSYFYAVDAATGKEKWRFHGGEDPVIHNQVGFQSSPAVVNGVVYTGCRDAQLYALDAATGKEKWHFDNALSWVITSPAVSDGKVFFATSDSSLYHVVDAATGKSILQPARQGLHVFVADDRGRRRLHWRPQRHAPGARSQNRRSALGFPNRNFKTKQRLGPDSRSTFQRPSALSFDLAGSSTRRDRSTVWNRRDFLFAPRR